MPNESRFTGHFRRPNETGPGFEITLSVGETATRISLGDDVLGTWPNSVIDLRNRSPLTLRILGETWLVSMPDPTEFLQVADARFSQVDDAPPSEAGATPADQPEHPSPPATDPAQAPDAEPAPDPGEETGSESPRSEPTSELYFEQPRRWSPSAPRIAWSQLALPSSGRSWGGGAAVFVLLVVAFAFDGPLATIAAVVAGAGAVLTASTAQRERDARLATPQVSLATADVEAQFARALGSAIGKSQASSGDIEDLMSVRGIGRQYAQILIGAGVGSLERLANLTPVQRAQVERALGTQGERLGRERWVEQAAKIVEERRNESGRRLR